MALATTDTSHAGHMENCQQPQGAHTHTLDRVKEQAIAEYTTRQYLNDLIRKEKQNESRYHTLTKLLATSIMIGVASILFFGAFIFFPKLWEATKNVTDTSGPRNMQDPSETNVMQS